MQALRNTMIATAFALIGTLPAMAEDDKSKGHIDLLSHGWAVPQDGNAAPATADGGYVLTGVQHPAKKGAGALTSLSGLGTSQALFANSRGGDQGNQRPTGTGKTMSASLLGKDTARNADAPALGLADAGAKPQTQAMGDGSVRFLKDSISLPPAAKPASTAVPTGSVTFKVDGVQPAGGGPAKGAALARK